MSVIVALFLTDSRNCQIPKGQAQSADNAFPIYRSPLLVRPAHRQGFGMGTIAKVQKVSEIHKESGKFFKHESVIIRELKLNLIIEKVLLD